MHGIRGRMDSRRGSHIMGSTRGETALYAKASKINAATKSNSMSKKSILINSKKYMVPQMVPQILPQMVTQMVPQVVPQIIKMVTQMVPQMVPQLTQLTIYTRTIAPVSSQV